ncbi:MAG: alpha/beta hydrolase-fold protein [Geminicoccaceae bacterium]
MGGFGTLHLGLREPERFRFLGALSPAVFEPDAAFPDIQLGLFAGAFGEPFDPSLFAAADPFNRIPLAAAAARPPAFYLATGADDYFGLEIGTFAFYRALDEAGVTAQVRILEGQHDWAFWRAQLPATLRSFAAAIAA